MVFRFDVVLKFRRSYVYIAVTPKMRRSPTPAPLPFKMTVVHKRKPSAASLHCLNLTEIPHYKHTLENARVRARD